MMPSPPPEKSTLKKPCLKRVKLENLLSQFALSYIINKSTHISQDFNSSIDLLLQINKIQLLIREYITHSNYHHQKIYRKFNLKILYLPSYERHIWLLNNLTGIKRFEIRVLVKKLTFWQKAIVSIMSNFTAKEIVSIDRDRRRSILK